MPNAPYPETAMTLASRHKDFSEWRKERKHYAIWAIDVDLPSLRIASTRMGTHLKNYLLPGYERQPHITLHICGFIGSDNGLEDNYTPEAFHSQIKSLELAQLEPFTIEIGPPKTFTSAPYFSVRDDTAGIARALQVLAMGKNGSPESEFPYVPHVTFGLYRKRFPVSQVLQRMLTCPGLEDIHVPVCKFVLMTYEAAVIAGPLSRVCEFDLERQTLRAIDASAMKVLLR